MANEIKVTRARIIIEGPDEDVMDVVNLALAGGILKEFHTEESQISVVDAKSFFGPRGPKQQAKRLFKAGDYVKVTGASAKYGVHGDEQGTIMKVHFQGRRSRVTVRWDDNTESEIGGSYLEILRPARERKE